MQKTITILLIIFSIYIHGLRLAVASPLTDTQNLPIETTSVEQDWDLENSQRLVEELMELESHFLNSPNRTQQKSDPQMSRQNSSEQLADKMTKDIATDIATPAQQLNQQSDTMFSQWEAVESGGDIEDMNQYFDQVRRRR